MILKFVIPHASISKDKSLFEMLPVGKLSKFSIGMGNIYVAKILPRNRFDKYRVVETKTLQPEERRKYVQKILLYKNPAYDREVWMILVSEGTKSWIELVAYQKEGRLWRKKTLRIFGNVDAICEKDALEILRKKAREFMGNQP